MPTAHVDFGFPAHPVPSDGQSLSPNLYFNDFGQVNGGTKTTIGGPLRWPCPNFGRNGPGSHQVQKISLSIGSCTARWTERRSFRPSTDGGAPDQAKSHMPPRPPGSRVSGFRATGCRPACFRRGGFAKGPVLRYTTLASPLPAVTRSFILYQDIAHTGVIGMTFRSSFHEQNPFTALARQGENSFRHNWPSGRAIITRRFIHFRRIAKTAPAARLARAGNWVYRLSGLIPTGR